MKTKKISGYIMFGIGFGMIILNAIDYLFRWDFIPVIIGILGLIFVIIGMKNIRKERR